MGVHEESLQPHHRQRNKNNSCFLLATIPPFCIMICIWALMGKSCPKNKQDLSERCLREVFGNCQAVTYARRMELMDSLTPDRLCWNENALCSPWHSLGKFCWPEPSDHGVSGVCSRSGCRQWESALGWLWELDQTLAFPLRFWLYTRDEVWLPKVNVTPMEKESPGPGLEGFCRSLKMRPSSEVPGYGDQSVTFCLFLVITALSLSFSISNRGGVFLSSRLLAYL